LIGKLNFFEVRDSVHGAYVCATADVRTYGCISDEEIDFLVSAMKADLDACARKMQELSKKKKGQTVFD
jgi:hypothetical protein